MNKQEAIGKIKNIETLNINDRIAGQQVDMVVKNQVLDIISQLDEPEKPVVPEYVADWYEVNCGDLNGALFTMMWLWDEKSRNSDFYQWFRKDKEAFQTLVNMHQFGYEVEKDKKYIVKFKNFRTDANYLKQDLVYQEYYLGGTHVNKSIILEHTREELELNGLGWVFSCEGVEVKEVE